MNNISFSGDTKSLKLNNIDEYQNILELLKQALTFYADENNYKINYGVSFIHLDCGSQARFALDKLKELEENNKNLEKDYTSMLNDFNVKNDLFENLE